MDRSEPLLELAPLDLINHRTRRYHGDDLCVSVTEFSVDDQQRLRFLYRQLQSLLELLSPDQSGPSVQRTKAFLRQGTLEEFVNAARSFGRSSYAAQPTPRMAKAIHDLRGGGLTPLVAQLELARLLGLSDVAVNALYFLTRDHLKIMRNALLGLDDAKRQEDLLPKIHGTDFIVQKWQGATLHSQDRDIRLEVDCPIASDISECCVEFGALDRILYNLINNACRHSAGDSIRLTLFPVPSTEGENLRLVLQNAISDSDREHLSALEMGKLFEEGTSTTGSGYGLAIATEFVTHAYGLKNSAQAIAGGYLGAALLENSFAAWFHWPRILED